MFFDELCFIMGFDEVTTTIIKQRIPVDYELLKVLRDSKSDEEVQEFIKKAKEAREEGRG